MYVCKLYIHHILMVIECLIYAAFQRLSSFSATFRNVVVVLFSLEVEASGSVLKRVHFSVSRLNFLSELQLPVTKPERS